MVVVQSNVTLVDMPAGWWPAPAYGSLTLYDQFTYDYATLYRTQSNIRVCVDFLARNIAQLGLHVFRRVSETDRERLRDHDLARLLAAPLPSQYKVTRYRLIESLVADLGVYFNAFWLKLPSDTGGVGGLLRIPPPYVAVKGGLVPTAYEVTIGGKMRQVRLEEIVHFRGYNAENTLVGLSPLETLRRVLAEEHAAGDYREHFWQHAARMHGVIERPADAPEWSMPARERFKSEFEALYSGGENSGKTAVLEEGMSWKQVEFNAQESEYLGGRKLTREECARAYHIPLPMVGILDHATFSNIKEQHKQLYQDSLGPWLAMIEDDINLQLVSDFADTDDVYVEFNIAEKMQGSFEEQTEAMQMAVGRPWMTPNEARARLNMPSLAGDADKLATPLNVLIGGQAMGSEAPAQDADPAKTLGEAVLKAILGTLPYSSPQALEVKTEELDPRRPRLRARYEEQWTRMLVRTFERQRAAVAAKMPKANGGQTTLPTSTVGTASPASTADRRGGAGAEVKAEMPELTVLWDEERWNREVADDFYGLSYETVMEWARYVAKMLDITLAEEEMLPWVRENARIAAEYANAVTREQLEGALREDDPGAAVRRVFELAVGVRAGQFALSRVTGLIGFGTQEAARQGGLRTKTWRTGKNPRDTHAAMNGVTVWIRDTFPNGLRWPGDSRGSADETAGCNCDLVYGR